MRCDRFSCSTCTPPSFHIIFSTSASLWPLCWCVGVCVRSHVLCVAARVDGLVEERCFISHVTVVQKAGAKVKGSWTGQDR